MLKYNTDQFVKKINAPIVCKVDGKKLAFKNGETLTSYEFDKKYGVDCITIEDGKTVITLQEQGVPKVNWIGEEAVCFF